jgi:hypothetical protein
LSFREQLQRSPRGKANALNTQAKEDGIVQGN